MRERHPFPSPLAIGLLVIAALAVPAGSARAGFMEAIGFSPRSAAMGGAAVAVAETPDAWYYNPAGLAQIEEDVQEVGFPQIAFLSLEQSNNTGSGGHLTDVTPTIYTVAFPGTFHVGVKGLVFGLGGGSTFGETAEWSQTRGDLRFSGYESSVLLNTLSPCVSYELLPGLYLGATFNIDALREIEGRQKLGDGYFTDGLIAQVGQMIGGKVPPWLEEWLRKRFSTLDGQDDGKLEVESPRRFPTGLAPTNTLDYDFESFSWHAGVLWRPIAPLRLGVTYRSPMEVKFRGRAWLIWAEDVKQKMNSDKLFLQLNGGPLQDEMTTFKAPVVFPQQVAFGVALNASEKVLLALDGVWTNWSDAWDEQTVTFEGAGLGGMKKQTFVRDFRDTYEVRLGGEYKVSEKIWTEAGVWWDPTPVPDHTIDSGTLDADRVIFSVGTTLKGILADPTGWKELKGLDLGLVFQWMQFFDRDIENGESSNLGGTRRYGTSVNDFDFSFSGRVVNLGVSLTYSL